MIRLNNKGESFVFPCIVVLVIAMILAMVIFYANVMTVIQVTKDNTERVLDSFVIKNSKEIYASIKQGNDFVESFDESLYISDISNELSLGTLNNMFYSKDENGEVTYMMTIPEVSFSVENELKLKVKYNIIIPIYFAGRSLSNMTIPITVNSHYTLKG